MKNYQIIALSAAFLTIAVLFSFNKQGQQFHVQSNGLQIEMNNNVGKISALPPMIIAGQIHYSRIPVQYWEHRLKMTKAMGFNALSIYIMWNYHEVEKGKFDYSTGNKNLTLFLALAQKYGFYVLIRPGPYVCAQWDFGGFPTRLLNIKGIKLRANNQIYLDQVQVYFKSLVPVLKPFWAQNGGPIVLLQIENQYGFYGTDKTYIQALRQMWHNLGVQCQQYYVDTASNIAKCHWSGANIGINNGISQQQYSYAKTLQPKGKLFGGQIYSGWLTHWGEKFQGKTLERYMNQFTFLFSKNHSFSMYMVHGGSNFGLTAGANAKSGNSDYTAHITSYDYDAPINEQGSPNEKYYKFRELAKNYITWQLPEVPQSLPVISIPAFKPQRIANLFSNLPNPAFTKSDNYFLFETEELKMFNQGFVLYETTINKNMHYLTVIVRDFAVVYLDGVIVKYLDRSVQTKNSLEVNCTNQNCKLSILVEAMGHINFDHAMENDRKGLFFFNDTRATKFLWTMYKINVDEQILKWTKIDNPRNAYALLKGTFNLTQVGDTFFNMKNYLKGYVWVNGVNLGRYWNRGPSQKVFCPGVWLKKGVNQIHVLDLQTDIPADITGDKTLK